MPYQYKREPLTPDEANRLAAACETHQERFIVWTLLDTGLRVSELAGLTREHIDWQNHRLMIYGKRYLRHKVKAPHHSPHRPDTPAD
jgi:integrase/recombinase XerD